MQPLSGNQRPDLLTALMKMSLVLRLPRKMHLSRSSSNIPHLPSFLEMLQNHHVLLTFVTRSLIPCTCHAERHLNVKKWSEHVVLFVHFDFEMCFAPQRRALLRHLNFQNWSEHVVFVHFDLEMCFAPHRRAIFHLSSGQLAPHPPL